jgi:hypothetical protein
MPRITQVELPWLLKSDVDLGRSFDVGGVKLLITIPLAVAMAMCAL